MGKEWQRAYPKLLVFETCKYFCLANMMIKYMKKSKGPECGGKTEAMVDLYEGRNK